MDDPGTQLHIGSPPVLPEIYPSPHPVATPSACPATYLPPNPFRPQAVVSFTLGSDYTTITGHEQMTFVPDVALTQVVLRMWPNSPISADAGGHMTLVSASVNGLIVKPVISEEQTLIQLPLAKPILKDSAVAVTADFSLTLPSGVNERYGHKGNLAWWGTGYPMLAFEPGHGWDTEPPTSEPAETATSEDMALILNVTTPNSADTVVATGSEAQRVGNTWTFTADAVRDLVVAVGHFTEATGNSATGVRIDSFVAEGLPDNPEDYVNDQIAAVNDHVHRFGPFPYPALVSITLPDVNGGIEYPGVILYGTKQTGNGTPSHEVAHQWFYGLVGNDQARDPWLDESLATFSEALHRNTNYASTAIPSAGLDKVGAPMVYWQQHLTAYFDGVYVQGAAALVKARNTVGAARFDPALRCYINANAHQIATPGSFARAFKSLPQVIAIMRQVGALP